MACCEVLFGTVPPTAPPSEAQIPLYIDRTSKKVYYWNGTGWELIWEIQTAGNGTPGVVAIDPNSPIYLGPGGTLQINCERLKTQCGFATADEISKVVTNTINEFIKTLNTTIQNIDSRVTNLSNKVTQLGNDVTNLGNTVTRLGNDVTNLGTTVTQLGQDLTELDTRVTGIEKWDLCAKTASCGYSTKGGGPVGGVTKLLAGPNITLTPSSGIGEVTITAAGGSGGGGGGGVTQLIAGTNITLSPASGTGAVTINAAGGVTPPPPPGPAGGVMDYGGWRIMMGGGNTVTGYMDPVNFVAPLDGVFAISITEGNATGWGAPGAGNRVPKGPSVFGWTRHPTDPSNKFLISVGLRNEEGDFIYMPGVTFSYIAYGKKPG